MLNAVHHSGHNNHNRCNAKSRKQRHRMLSEESVVTRKWPSLT